MNILIEYYFLRVSRLFQKQSFETASFLFLMCLSFGFVQDHDDCPKGFNLAIIIGKQES